MAEDRKIVRTPSMKTCFIAALAGKDLRALRSGFESRGVALLVPQYLKVGADWLSVRCF